MSEYQTISYEEPAAGVVRLVQNRPAARNAQNLQLTYDLNAALDEAAQDDAVKVIVIAGAGPHFSSGHDLRGDGGQLGADFDVVGTWGGFGAAGAEGLMGRERAGAQDPDRSGRPAGRRQEALSTGSASIPQRADLLRRRAMGRLR